MRLTSENTAVVLDSASDFPEAAQLYPNFRVVPLYVRFGDESFKDYVELGPDRFYERLGTTTVQPTTSQPTPGDFLAVYEEVSASYERVLSLQLSSTLSGTYASAQTAAEMLGGDRVRVIDTRTVSAAIAMLALGVRRRLESGTTDEEIDAFVARFQREHRLLFTVSTLEYLQRGGRIGRAAALAGNLLNVKPILTIRDGEVVPLKKVRGNAEGVRRVPGAVRGDVDRRRGAEDRDRARGGARSARGAARARRARPPARRHRDRDPARRRDRHPRRSRHGRVLLVRGR